MEKLERVESVAKTPEPPLLLVVVEDLWEDVVVVVSEDFWAATRSMVARQSSASALGRRCMIAMAQDGRRGERTGGRRRPRWTYGEGDVGCLDGCLLAEIEVDGER